jgi:Leucine-rich repeat (LRR) protein
MKPAGTFLSVLAVVVLGWTGGARAQVIVTFPDPNLEAVVRARLGYPAGPLAANELATLTSLSATYHHITNLSGLEYATNLTFLMLSGNAITDVSPLSTLSRLSSLSLGGNNLSDLRCLTNLTLLTNLSLSFNRVHDAAPLLALTNLAALDVGSNPLSNYALLGNLVNLRSLVLEHLSIRDPSFVNSLTNLNWLDLLGNQIGRLPALPGLANLGYLDLGYNPLTNAAALSGLTNLKSLWLDQCPLADADFLAFLTRLHFLSMQYINLDDISPLAGLTNLSTLLATGNPFTNATALTTLPNLTALSVGRCSLPDLSFLGSLTGLQQLEVQGAGISDLAPILELTNLAILYLNENRITDISGLEGLPALQSLSLLWNLLDLTTGSPALTVISNLQARGVSVSYEPQNQPPTLQVPASWTVQMDRTATLQLYVFDDITLDSNLVVTATSADTNLVPQAGLALEHIPYSLWNLALTPATGRTGTTTVTLTVTDDTGLSATTNLAVTVYSFPPVTFPDTNLEAAVRATLNRPTGPLTTYDVGSLTYLSAAWRSITSLAGLGWATNLTSLYLSGNPLTDLGPLRALPALQSLEVGYNNLRDLSPLLALTNLTSLTLDGNPGPNLAQLAALPHLATLYANNCSLSNLAGIGGLAHLQWLVLGENSLRDPAPVAALTNLTYLDLHSNPLGGTAGLAGVTHAAYFNLSGCSLSNLSGLQGLTNLTALNLDSNPLTSVAPLAGLPRLTLLSLGSCFVSNLVSVQGLTPLQSLYLSYNGIRDLTPLAGLTNLTTLVLSGNSPTDFAPLAGLPSLSSLGLSSCSLTNIGSLALLTQVRSLDLSYNRIADITPLQGLTDLYSLSLAVNCVSNITSLQNLAALRGVNVTLNLLDLSAGSSTMITITNLQNQGALVTYDPQNQPPGFYDVRTNWVIRPSVPANLQFAVADDVTLADKVAVTVACSSAGPLSNSAVTLVRTSFAIPTGPPGRPWPWPLPFPPRAVLPSTKELSSPLRPYGGGVSYWDLSVTPTLNQTGTMTLTLTATDDTGFSTNDAILVTVAPPAALDGAVVEATNLVWQTGGNAPWFGQTDVAHSGPSAAQSGSVGANEDSWLQTTVTGPGILTFWWRRVTTGYGGQFSFTTSRGGSLSPQSTTDWQRAQVSIPAGDCVLSWSYLGSLEATSDRGWLDQVSFTPTASDFWLEGPSHPAPSGATVLLHGEPNGLYELQVSTNLSHWTPLSRVVMSAMSDFTALASDPSAQAGPRFYRARQLPAGTMWFAPFAFDAAGAPLLQLYSQPGAACEIQGSTDLHTWSALATLTNTTGTVTFTDTPNTLVRRFYRARWLP